MQLAQFGDDARQGDLGVMFTGGGARAAYQVGLLRGIARHFPAVHFQVVTGVSAGAINAAFLAARPGSLAEQTEDLARLWCELECSHIYQFDWRKMIPFRSALASMFPKKKWSRPHALVDTTPLRNLLMRVLNAFPGMPIPGIVDNLRAGRLHAVALMTLDYSTGQSVRWVQGRNIDAFEGPNRRSQSTEMTVDHVLASSALPFIFPAVRIQNQWHGDGGIRLAAPLSPAVHLGARRIIAMSTGYQRTDLDASTPSVTGYPPAAQIIGQLLNAIFLDVIDEDVVRMERMNAMLRKLPPQERGGFKPIDLLVMRPSVDLGVLAADYERYLPRNLKLIVRALGSKETESPDFVSMLLFQPEYTKRLIEIGEADVEARLDEIHAFFGEPAEESESALA
ncbi:MAG TPA: patatin-like phospholipase family protein [Thermoanaerobaculia bacterium]|jgi:NTE family protein